jgi:hypothetical protein
MNGWESSSDSRPVTHSGRSSTLTYVDVKERINQRIRDNKRIDTDQIATKLRITHRKSGSRITKASTGKKKKIQSGNLWTLDKMLEK